MNHTLVKITTSSKRRQRANAVRALCSCGHKSYGAYRLDALDAWLGHNRAMVTAAILDAWATSPEVIPCGEPSCAVCGDDAPVIR